MEWIDFFLGLGGLASVIAIGLVALKFWNQITDKDV